MYIFGSLRNLWGIGGGNSSLIWAGHEKKGVAKKLFGSEKENGMFKDLFVTKSRDITSYV